MTDEGVNLLREAIVVRAVKDYKKLASGKKRHPKYGLYKVNELEEFFTSQWFSLLVDMDGEWIMNKIKQMYSQKGDGR